MKPHGALYNTVVRDTDQAGAVVEGVRRIAPTLPVLGLPGSVFLRAAGAAGLPSVAEGFADRAYDGSGALVSRRQPGAVREGVDAVVAQAVELACRHQVTAVTGEFVPVAVRSVCVHGDTAGAVTIARAFSDTFAGIRLIDVPLFVAAQVVGAFAATMLFGWLMPADNPRKRQSMGSAK